MMNRRRHRILLWLVAALAIIGVGALVVSRTSVGEMVKRESARVFDYEYIPNQNVNIDSCGAAKGMDSIYTDFRKKYRFHYQGIGMASFADSSRMILLSDLPPHFETDSVASIFAGLRTAQSCAVTPSDMTATLPIWSSSLATPHRRTATGS